MKRRSWIITPLIIGLVLFMVICLSAYIPNAFASTDIPAKNETETTSENVIDVIETVVAQPKPETQESSPNEIEEIIIPETTAPETTINTPETTVPETTIQITETPTYETTIPEIESSIETTAPTEEKHEGCNHFWRKEYDPETKTEAGCIFESCLYCGEWYILEIIPPIGN